MALHKAWAGKGLVIMLFPCNQFGGQEPGTAAEIQAFAEGQGAPVGEVAGGFVMMEKVNVNGDDTHQVYRFLKSSTAGGDLKWNFASYWLIGKDGGVERLEGLKTFPDSFGEKVAAILGA